MNVSGPVRIDVWRGNGKVLMIFGDEHYSREGECFNGVSVNEILDDKIREGGIVYVENLPLEYRKIFNIHSVPGSDWLGMMSNWAFNKEKTHPGQIVFVDVRYPAINGSMSVIEKSLNNAELNLDREMVNERVSNTVFMEAFGDIGILLKDNYEFLKTGLHKKCVLPFISSLSEEMKVLLLRKQHKFFTLIESNPFIHKNDFDFFCEEVYKAFSYYQDVFTLERILTSTAKYHYLCLGWGHLDTLKYFLIKKRFQRKSVLCPIDKDKPRCIRLPVNYIIT